MIVYWLKKGMIKLKKGRNVIIGNIMIRGMID